MEAREQQSKPRDLKVDSVESWERLVSQANNQGCPLYTLLLFGVLPSVAMNPFFEEVASSYPDVPFLSVDVDDVKDVASKLEIKAMPTFVLMREGAVVDKLVGANPEEIRKRIDSFVQSVRIFIA